MRPAFKTATDPGIQRLCPQECNILKDSDRNLTGDDVREGLTAVISREARAMPSSRARPRPSWAIPRSRSAGGCTDLRKAQLTYLEENPGCGHAPFWTKVRRCRPGAGGCPACAGTDPAQIRSGDSLAARTSWQTASGAGHRAHRDCTSSRETRRAALPRAAATAATRRSFPCGARCSTWKRHGWTKCMATTS